MIENEVTFGEKKLHGTMLKPAEGTETFPAILLLPGSGPIDRNGNNKSQDQLNIYNRLAESLTELGFLTLRYDKEGTGESEGDYSSVGLWDIVEGAKEALCFLQDEASVNSEKIFILGHSEGALLAPLAAKGKKIAGLILLAGGTETMHEAMVNQRRLVVEGLKVTKGFKKLFLRLFKVIDKVEKQGPVFDRKINESTEDTIRIQGTKINAKWFREHFQYDVKEEMKQVTCPVLAITGSKDLQATPDSVYDIHELVHGETEASVINGMNHMLRQQEEDFSMLHLKKAYKGVGEKPISAELIQLIKEWLKRYT